MPLQTHTHGGFAGLVIAWWILFTAFCCRVWSSLSGMLESSSQVVMDPLSRHFAELWLHFFWLVHHSELYFCLIGLRHEWLIVIVDMELVDLIVLKDKL